MRIWQTILTTAAILLLGCAPLSPQAAGGASDPVKHWPVEKTDAEWHKILSNQQFRILRQADTEPPFRGRYDQNHQAGEYYCVGCNQHLFSSKTKFDSGTGWPSFWAPVSDKAIVIREDHSDGMDRTEVLCARCGGHLGHVFSDGPAPTGKRFCMNGLVLNFKPGK